MQQKGRSLCRRRGWSFRSSGGGPHKSRISAQAIVKERTLAERKVKHLFCNNKRLDQKTEKHGENGWFPEAIKKVMASWGRKVRIPSESLWSWNRGGSW